MKILRRREEGKMKRQNVASGHSEIFKKNNTETEIEKIFCMGWRVHENGKFANEKHQRIMK